MTADELIEALRALPAKDRKLPVTSYESTWLVELEPPRIGYRDTDGLEAPAGERVVVL
jgi:hypothetical protein